MKKITAILAAAVICLTSGCSAGYTEINGKADLIGRKIGVQQGTTGMEYAEKIENASVQSYGKTSDAVQALIHGKVDAVIIDSAPAEYFAKKNEQLKIISDAFEQEEYAIAVAQSNEELLKQINDIITEFQQDGTLDQITQNWLIEEEKGRHPYQKPEIKYEGKLIVATNAEFPPYEYTENNEIVGFDIDLMRAVADRLYKELVIENMDFKYVLSAVESGKADCAAAGITITEGRQESVSFTLPYSSASQVIMAKAPEE